MREIHEVTGLNVTVEKLLYATTFKTNPSRRVVLLTCLCRCESSGIVLSKEHSDYQGVAKEQLKLLLPKAVFALIVAFRIILSSGILLGFVALFEKFLNQEFIRNRKNPEADFYF